LKTPTACMIFCLSSTLGWTAEPLYEACLVYDPDEEDHGHVHASCIVECPNGDLRACWYENGPELPEGFYRGDRDKSDDVRIGGARKEAGKKAWDPPLVMADTFGVSDNNPCMVIDREERLWLFHPTLLCVPERSWGSALIQYHISSRYQGPGCPKWDHESLLIMRPRGFVDAYLSRLKKVAEKGQLSEAQWEKERAAAAEKFKDPFRTRFGWMSRAHPLIRSDGALLLPLANENYGLAAMAITQDAGKTWTFSDAVPQRGLIQPTVVECEDGKLMAFFRNGFPSRRILKSESNDGGMTWSGVTETPLLHPGSGIEALRLRSGRLLMVYNDKTHGPRDSLAVSLSDDDGETWPHIRHLEQEPGGRFDYPSVIQSKDGTLHASYSFHLKTIKHVHFNEAWVEAGDP